MLHYGGFVQLFAIELGEFQHYALVEGIRRAFARGSLHFDSRRYTLRWILSLWLRESSVASRTCLLYDLRLRNEIGVRDGFLRFARLADVGEVLLRSGQVLVASRFCKT